jgi:ribosomal-protein-alanine N-acetyltransferase
MMNFVTRLLTRSEPAFSEARKGDAAAIAAVHAASFQRGWGEDEIHRLIVDRNVVAHRVTIGQTLSGFILSRLAADEAEILSIADWPGSAPTRCFSRSASGMHRPAGSMMAQDSTKWRGAKPIMKGVRRPWCCVAT